MSRKVTIDVEARFVDNVTDESRAASKAVGDIGKEADKAKKKLGDLGKQKASPTFDADNNKFLNKIRSMEAKMKKMGHTKTAAVLDLVDKASTKIAKVLGKAKSFASKTWQGMLKIKDSNALNTIRKITNAAESFTRKTWTTMVRIKDFATAPLQKIKNSLFSIKSLVMAITAGMAAKQFVINPINLADQYSSAKIGFSTLLGDSAGQAMMNEIDRFAKATPFKTSGIISNVQKMMAYGWDVDRVIEDMETIGDAAAATGRGDQGLESIVYALSEIRSKGKLSTQELNQLASAGIKAKAYLAEGLGFGTDDAGFKKLAEALEDGSIGANQAIDLILQGMKEFDGMMDRTANETVEGLKAQLEDTFEINILRRWGQGLQDGAKRGLGSIVSLLDKADGALTKLGDTIYAVGEAISNWVATKLENAVKRITEITDSYEFQNAGLGEKISMLWNGVIVDPLKEWWNGGGKEKTAQTAGKIGKWIGETLTKVLLAVFGMTDVLKESGLDEEGGMGIAQSFAKGFIEGFDVSAITDKLLQAINNVWNALPWWGKILVGGYIGGKAASGIGNVIGGISNLVGGAQGTWGSLKGLWGTPGNNMVRGTGLSSLLASVGYKLTGGAAGSTLTGSQAAGVGGIGIGSALTVLNLGGKAIGNFGDAYGHFKEGDSRSGWADVTRGGFTTAGVVGGGILGGLAAGGKLGATIGSAFTPLGTVVGALAGAALGGIISAFVGDTIAKNIEKAKWESEEMKEAIEDGEKSAEEMNEIFAKAKWENAKKHFGDIALSMDEIQRLSTQIVWGNDLETFEKFVSATTAAEQSMVALKQASQEADKWMWKAGLGVRFNADEQKAFRASFDSYYNAAKNLLENKHYEFSASAALILDLESDEGKSILDSGNAFYSDLQKDLEEAGEELGNALTDALADGIIEAPEKEAINAAQQKVIDIMNKIADAEMEANLELIKVKWGGGNLDYESFDAFMTQMETDVSERMEATDNAFEIQIANLKLRYPEKGDAYKTELTTILSGYKARVEEIKADVLGVQLNIIGEAYASEFGLDAATDLKNALEYSIENDIDPINIDDKKLAELLNFNGELGGETAGQIKDMLSRLFNQSGMMVVDQDVLMKLGVTDVDVNTDEAIELAESQFSDKQLGLIKLMLKGEVDKVEVDDVAEAFNGALTAELNNGHYGILTPTGPKDAGVPDIAATVLCKLEGKVEVTDRIEVMSEMFGIDKEILETIMISLYPELNPASITPPTASQFGILPTYTYPTSINLTPQANVSPLLLDNYLLGVENSYDASPTVNITPEEQCTQLLLSGADFGVQDSYTFETTVNVNANLGHVSSPFSSGEKQGKKRNFRGGIVGGESAMGSFYRGGIAGFSDGGMVRGGSQLIEVAEEGSPEMIIPLSSQRRGRALKLWAQAGNIMGVPGFARGGLTSGGADEGIRFHNHGEGEAAGGQSVQVEIAGITFEIHVNGNDPQSIAEAIQAQSAEIAESVAGVLADALSAQFENTPARGGRA